MSDIDSAYVSVPLTAEEWSTLYIWCQTSAPDRARRIIGRALVRMVIDTHDAEYLASECSGHAELLRCAEAIEAGILGHAKPDQD